MLKVLGAVLDVLAILIVTMRLVASIADNTCDIGDKVMLLCMTALLATGLVCIIKRIRSRN